MPALYAHRILAEEMLKRLPAAVAAAPLRFPDEYTLGAEGGDPFFLLGGKGEKNPGRALHRTAGAAAFRAMRDRLSARPDPAALAYALGFCSHYAADVAFHPYVHSAEEKFGAESGRHRRDKLHFLIESDLDVFLVRLFRGAPAGGYRFPYPDRSFPSEELVAFLSETFSRALGETLEPRRIRRAIRRFYAGQKLLEDPSSRRRRAALAAENLFGAPHTVSFLIRRSEPDPRFLNEEKEEWHYPSAPELTSTESVREIAGRAAAEGAELLAEFFAAATEGGELSPLRFGRDFHTGL